MSFSAVNVQSQLNRVWEVLRLAPFDTSTQEGRSKERYRRVILSAVASITAKAVTAITTLVSIPLTVNYLGAERYGMWMTISSVIAMMAFADLGMGNGLVNSIAEADGRSDRTEAVKYVSSGFFMLLGMAGLIIFLFFASYSLIPWYRIFNVTSDLAVRESGPALTVFVVCFAANIPLSVVERVQVGYQQGFASSLWQSVGSFGGLIGVLLTVHFGFGLTWLVLSMAGVPTLALAINWVVQFFWRQPWLRPNWSQIDRASCRKLAKLGALFLVLQILNVIGSASDNLIIAQIFGASAVAGYAVVQKLFSIALLSQYFISPLWPAFGEALARRDFSWAKRTLHHSIILGVGLGAIFAIPFAVLGQQIIKVWISIDLVPSRMLLVGFASYAIWGGYMGAMSAFLNGASLLKGQILFFSAASLVALALKIILARYWQIAGVVWATVVAYGFIYAIPAWLLAHQHLAKVRKELLSKPISD